MKTIQKDITFVYADSAERSMYEPIAAEAEKRGYTTRMTKDKYVRGEICFYCEHVNFPQYSKFSVIMLHDIIQQYANWPDIWFREPWDKYDIGILPSTVWRENWTASSDKCYVHPRCGVYEIGWPKADIISTLMNNTYRSDFFEQHGLNESKRTILYAPSWENDAKQDDFVQAMLNLDVNILIKHANWDHDLFPGQIRNIKEMTALHRNINSVTILDPTINIFEAIAVSDILISDESSTMCEAILMGIPAVSVSDWRVPDTPTGFPTCSYDFVEMTKRETLSECTANMLEHYEQFRSKAEQYSRKNFSHVGKASAMIMDVIDDCLNGKPSRYEAIPSKATKPLSPIRAVRHYAMRAKWEMSANYAINNKLFGTLYRGLRFCWYGMRGKKIPREGSAL